MRARHRRSWRECRTARLEGPLRLNLGCGPNLKSGWVNIDLVDARADFRLDVREAWPFQDGSVSAIYSGHFFEHLEYPEEACFFLREALRVLEPGGLLSTGVPHTEAIIEAYHSRGGASTLEIACIRSTVTRPCTA